MSICFPVVMLTQAHKGGFVVNSKKVIYLLIVVFAVVLAGTLAWDIERYIHTEQYASVVEKVYRTVRADNETTQSVEDMWDRIEENDDSAIRAQLYEMKSIRSRLSNIDSTVEQMITINSSLLQVLTSMLKLQFYMLITMVVFLIVFIFCSLLLR